jgi:ribosomal protein S18 acetylase RimI-like enzyme
MRTDGAAVIERLAGALTPDLDALLTESEQEGLRLVRRLVDEWTTSSNRFDRPGEALFAARAGERLVGVCGLNVDPYAVQPEVGRLRHLYVLSAYRRLGVGRLLVEAVLEAARGRFGLLRLRTTNPAAARLYESLGFRIGGGPDCSHTLELKD